MLVLMSITLHAQRVDPQLLNTSGIALVQKDFKGYLSLGEIAVTTLEGPGGIITQGFLQPEVNKPCDELLLRYYPNPVANEITILDDACGRRIVEIHVFDTNGRRVNNYVLKNRTANLDLLVPGVFLVRAYGVNQRFLGSFKIVKQTMLRG
jgi:hypothetical protein